MHVDGSCLARTDVDTDPATAEALSVIAAAWIDLVEEQEWLNADWWS
jgi:hypothetical protein